MILSTTIGIGPYLPSFWQQLIAKCKGFRNLFWTLLGRLPWSSPTAPVEEDEPPKNPRHITYRAIPGSWQRILCSHWPDSVFQVPKEVPYGTICYVTKGYPVGFGATAHVERLLPSGNVVKYPIPNPYSPLQEEDNRVNMRIEADIYHRLGDCPYVPKLISWEPESCCLTLQFLDNGDLSTYVQETTELSAELRRRWTLQAARALDALHQLDVVHCDVNPRNFLLDAALNLRIADFAGSAFAGDERAIGPGPRYLPPGWTWDWPAAKSEDIFGLGSVIYFIMHGDKIYPEETEEEVEELLAKDQFPDVSHIECGATIRGCWDGTLETTAQVIDSLPALYVMEK